MKYLLTIIFIFLFSSSYAEENLTIIADTKFTQNIAKDVSSGLKKHSFKIINSSDLDSDNQNILVIGDKTLKSIDTLKPKVKNIFAIHTVKQHSSEIFRISVDLDKSILEKIVLDLSGSNKNKLGYFDDSLNLKSNKNIVYIRYSVVEGYPDFNNNKPDFFLITDSDIKKNYDFKKLFYKLYQDGIPIVSTNQFLLRNGGGATVAIYADNNSIGSYIDEILSANGDKNTFRKLKGNTVAVNKRMAKLFGLKIKDYMK